MKRFEVVFHPDLPHVPVDVLDGEPPADFPWNEVNDVVREKYDVRLMLDGHPIGYYPATISDVFFDVYSAWTEFKQRRSYTLCLSGYPVLDIDLSTDKAVFYHAYERHLDERRKPIGAAHDTKVVERVLKDAVDKVWSVISYARTR